MPPWTFCKVQHFRNIKHFKWKSESAEQNLMIIVTNQCVPANLLELVACHIALWQPSAQHISTHSQDWEFKAQGLCNKNTIYGTSFKTRHQRSHPACFHFLKSQSYSACLENTEFAVVVILWFNYKCKARRYCRGLKKSHSLNAGWAQYNYREGKPRQSQRNSFRFVPQWKDSLWALNKF